MTKLAIGPDLKLPLDWMALATVVYGARGSGKTVLGGVIAEEVTKAGQRFCAIDLKGDWYGLKATADGKGEGIPAVVFGGDHKDVPLEEGAGAELGNIVAELDQSVILDLEHLSKGKQVRFLAAFFERLYDANREPLLLLLDEAQRYAPQKPWSPEATICLGAVEDLVKLGRKHGLGVVVFTQRGSGLNKEVSELADMLVAFRTPGPLDQERIQGWLDANTTKAQRDEVMGRLAGLDTGTAIFASGHPDLKVFQVAHVRMKETFDSSATPKIGRAKKEPKRLAKPDLQALNARMSSAIERAKADDPKELRRRIVELERAAKSQKPAAVHAVRVEEKEVIRKIEVPVLKDTQLKRLEAVSTRLVQFGERVVVLGDNVVSVGREITAALARLHQPTNGHTPTAPSYRRVPTSPPLIKAAREPRPPARQGDFQPSRSQIKILNALAFLEQIEVRPADKTQLALLSDQSPTSGGYFNNLGCLRSAGLIDYPSSGMVGLTEDGRGIADPGDAPQTDEELQRALFATLSGPQVKILEVLIAEYPNAVGKDSLAEQTNQSPTSGGYFNNLGRLRTLGLIDYPRPGEVAAQPVLFLERSK